MTPFEEAMAAPRIEVIDAAIARIENGQEVFTRLALGAAVRSAFPGLRALRRFRQLCLDAAK